MDLTVNDYIRLIGACGVAAIGIWSAYQGRWDIAMAIMIGGYGGVNLPTTKLVTSFLLPPVNPPAIPQW